MNSGEVYCTLRRKIYKNLTLFRLGDMVAAYNHTRHCFTGFAPAKVERSNVEEVF